MPTYTYQCEVCKHTFDEFQRITEEPLKVCPECNGKINRVISGGGGVLLKGGGFYTTDYRSENYKKRAKEDIPSSSSACSDKGCSKCPSKS